MKPWVNVAVGITAGVVAAVIAVLKAVKSGEPGDRDHKPGSGLLDGQFVCDQLSVDLIKSWFEAEAGKCESGAIGILLKPSGRLIEQLGLDDSTLDPEHYMIQIMYDNGGAEELEEILPEKIVSMRLINYNTLSAAIQPRMENQGMLIVTLRGGEK